MVGRRRDRFLLRVPPERVIELAADPSRFPEFNPIVRVPESSGRVEEVGNIYHQVFTLGSIRVSTRWETVRVDPPTLTERPAPPWTTVEAGQLPVFGAWSSTSRYDAVKAGTLVTHDLEYALPEGLAGRVLDLVIMRPLLAVGFGLLVRLMQRWIEADSGPGPESSAAGRAILRG
ncbi:MAG: SRPBCC family protein [Candidatus Limnocylindria bacterium]